MLGTVHLLFSHMVSVYSSRSGQGNTGDLSVTLPVGEHERKKVGGVFSGAV
jgi:hypothetical protein